jgi:VIT1/CCC1 family predicted Fe2+/Mn2+ transporter
VLLLPLALLVPGISGATLALLAALGAVAARLGGASVLKGSARVAFWGAAAMALTGAIGRLFGTTLL